MSTPLPSTSTPATQFDDAAARQMNLMLADLGRMYQERNDAVRQLTRAYQESLFMLAQAAEYKDLDMGVHLARIGFLAEHLATLLGMPPPWARMLRMAAPMHDIGKIGVPDTILQKAGPLLPEERALMNRHPEIGARILGKVDVPLLKMASEVALSHHERFDGQGYPHRLAGEDIPLSARIVAVVDVYDALTMDRVYRRAMTDEQAFALMTRERGASFDPRVLDIFLEHRHDFVTLRERINREHLDFADLLQE